MPGYEVHQGDGAATVLAATGAFLARDPVARNVILTLLRERAEPAGHPTPGRCWWVSRGEEVEGVALSSPPGAAASVTPMSSGALDALVPAIAGDLQTLAGVIGEAGTAAGFAGRWSELRGVGAVPHEGQRLYRLGNLQPPDGVPGGPATATLDHLDLLVAWWEGLAADVGEEPPTDTGVEVLVGRIGRGEIWLWVDDGQPVSMARLSLPAAGSVRIGFVYTPPDRRRHGYAGASVTAVSARALADGARECLLYTQLSNPTSNGIYRRIGYEAVSEVLSYRFQPR